MSDNKARRVEHETMPHTVNVMNMFIHIAFFFAIAALLSLFLFNDFLLEQVAKPEYATWLTVETQSKLTFIFRSISELFFILGLSSLSVVLYYMASDYISLIMKRIKSKFTKISK